MLLIRAAEVAGEALGQRALEKNGIALAKAERDDDDTDLSNLILAGAEMNAYRLNGKNGDSPVGQSGDHTDPRRLGLMQSKGKAQRG